MADFNTPTTPQQHLHITSGVNTTFPHRDSEEEQWNRSYIGRLTTYTNSIVPCYDRSKTPQL